QPAAGAARLGHLMAEQESRLRGFAEAQAGFDSGRAAEAALAEEEADPRGRRRFAVTESPLASLGRRRDRGGKPFLDEALVRAGERLREDFELAQMGPRTTQNWDHFLTSGVKPGAAAQPPQGAEAARVRFTGALRDLGPGLGDVALRCCCYLEGLEETERTMGWAARSGKVVLRIALQRLHRHYEALESSGGGLIG
ncbi:helix-turn-helix domain containing protein, partial [Yangia mangrovi]